MNRATESRPIWIKYARAAELMECSTDTIERRVKAGKLTAAGKGSGRRVLYDSVLNYRDGGNETRNA